MKCIGQPDSWVLLHNQYSSCVIGSYIHVREIILLLLLQSISNHKVKSVLYGDLP